MQGTVVALSRADAWSSRDAFFKRCILPGGRCAEHGYRAGYDRCAFVKRRILPRGTVRRTHLSRRARLMCSRQGAGSALRVAVPSMAVKLSMTDVARVPRRCVDWLGRNPTPGFVYRKLRLGDEDGVQYPRVLPMCRVTRTEPDAEIRL